MSNLECVAKDIFEILSRPENKARWSKQPEHIKEIFRKKAMPKSVFFHCGSNMVFKVTEKGQLITWKIEKQYQILRVNQEYGLNYKAYV